MIYEKIIHSKFIDFSLKLTRERLMEHLKVGREN